MLRISVFTTLEDSDKVESIALGGLTNGVYNYQLCGAFATIANGGVYNTPTLYTKILDHDGNVLLEGNKETKTVIKDSTAALLTSAMEDVVTSGTGRNAQLDNMPVAGKTGTTDHDQDLLVLCIHSILHLCSMGRIRREQVTDRYRYPVSFPNLEKHYEQSSCKSGRKRFYHAFQCRKEICMLDHRISGKTILPDSNGIFCKRFCT